jgi:hypothetical protein
MYTIPGYSGGGQSQFEDRDKRGINSFDFVEMIEHGRVYDGMNIYTTWQIYNLYNG